jgi:CheY-like chemotaxis protein
MALWRGSGEPDKPKAAPEDQPVHRPPSPTQVELPSQELITAWVQFLREHVANSVSGLHNRINAANALLGQLESEIQEPAQLELLKEIGEELRRAVNITQGMLSRVTSRAPDIAPPVWNVLREVGERPGRILVVEHDDSNRAVMARLFRGAGHEVIPVVSGLEAHDVLEHGEVDCVVCELHMPTVGGRAFFEQVEEAMPHMAARFVFVTGDFTRPESFEFLKATGQPLVGKPYHTEDLLDAVATILSRVGVLKAGANKPATE